MSKTHTEPHMAETLIGDLRARVEELTDLVDYYEYGIRLIEASDSLESMMQIASDTLAKRNLNALAITAETHPGIHKAFSIVCRDGYSGSGRAVLHRWRIPQRYQESLDHHEEVLSSLSEEDLTAFCNSDMQESARRKFFVEHQDTDEFLNDFYDNWSHA